MRLHFDEIKIDFRNFVMIGRLKKKKPVDLGHILADKKMSAKARKKPVLGPQMLHNFTQLFWAPLELNALIFKNLYWHSNTIFIPKKYQELSHTNLKKSGEKSQS